MWGSLPLPWHWACSAWPGRCAASPDGCPTSSAGGSRPRWHRWPELVTYGLSLGSYAAQAPFGSVGDITTRADGALFVGTPSSTPLWRTLTRSRDPDSPQWRPLVDGGPTVRFGADAADLASVDGPWGTARIAYLQHASDPVVWWSWDLLTREPDWLTEPRGPDVTARMHWYPVITFLQVSVDLMFAVTVPDGHGHNYTSQIVGAWAAVTQPAGWTPDRLGVLQDHLDAGVPSPPGPGLPADAADAGPQG